MVDEPEGGPDGSETVLPLAEERLTVKTVERVTGRVRVGTRTRTEAVEIDEPLASAEAEFRRVPVDRVVVQVPEIREEDGVTIIPVVEEVLVRQLVLREEIHVRCVERERRLEGTVELRVQEPFVERDPD